MVGIVQHYGTLTHIIIYTRVSACAIVLEVKEGAGLGVHRAVGVGVELAYRVACEGKRLLTLGKGVGCVVLRCRLGRKALVCADW